MESQRLSDAVAAFTQRQSGILDVSKLVGRYFVQCFRNGALLWEDVIENIVTDVGANHILDSYLNSAAFTQVGPFMSLISGTNYTGAPAAGNTMASHAGWFEAGEGAQGPSWQTTSARLTCNGGFNAAASRIKALSATKAFTINSVANGSTVKGVMMVAGSGAVATNNNTAGTLLSAGLFAGGDKSGLAGSDVLNVSWQLQLT
jgi:hypothetical protein